MRIPFFLCALLACASLFLLSARTVEVPVDFEYKIVSVRTFVEGSDEPRNPIEAAQKEANTLSAQGWELISTEVVMWDDHPRGVRDFTVVLSMRKQK